MKCPTILAESIGQLSKDLFGNHASQMQKIALEGSKALSMSTALCHHRHAADMFVAAYGQNFIDQLFRPYGTHR
jgi:hypothetical protein